MATVASNPPMVSHGLQTWAVQVRTRISRQSEMATLQEMITVQGDQWLESYFDDLVKAGPHRGAIADLMKTPGKKREGPKTRGATANAAKTKAKLTTANNIADKENNPVVLSNAAPPKKATRFQRALLEAREPNQLEQAEPEPVAAPVKKPASSSKKGVFVDPAVATVPSSQSDTPLNIDSSTSDATTIKNVKASKDKTIAKDKNAKTKGKVQTVIDDEPKDVQEPQPQTQSQADVTVQAELAVNVDADDQQPLSATSQLLSVASVADSVANIPANSPEPSSDELDPSHLTRQTPPPIATLASDNAIAAVADVTAGLHIPTSPILTAQDAASLSIIEEGDERSSVSPPASQPALAEVILDEKVESGDVEAQAAPRSTSPIARDFIDQPVPVLAHDLPAMAEPQGPSLPSRPPRAIPPPAAAAPVPVAQASVLARKSALPAGGPPVVNRGSGGLRSSWLTRALREDTAGGSVVPAAAPIVVRSSIAATAVLSQRGEKRKSSAMDVNPTATSAHADPEPANKMRKIGMTNDKELVKSAGSGLRPERAEEEELGVLERVKGKVEGLLVRADKEEDKNRLAEQEKEKEREKEKTHAEEPEAAPVARRLTSRLSVSDLVSVFEGRGTGSQLPPAADAGKSTQVADAVAEPDTDLLRSTTPPDSPPPPSRLSYAALTINANVAITAMTTVSKPVEAVAPKPTDLVVPTILEPRSPTPPELQSFPPSQSTQATYRSDSDFWGAVPGAFTQSTAPSSQFSVWQDDEPPTSQLAALAKGLGENLLAKVEAAVVDAMDITEDHAGHGPHVDEADVAATTAMDQDMEDVVEDNYLFDADPEETGLFPTFDGKGKGVMREEGVMSQPDPQLTSSVATLGFSTSSQTIPESSSQPSGLLAQAGAFVSKALGAGMGMGGAAAKKGKAEPLKSLQLAAAAAKKEQMEKDRKAARAKEIEERRHAVAQRRQEEEKAKEDEVKKQRAAEVEKRKRDREEATGLAKGGKVVRKGEEEPNKKRKLTVEVERKAVESKKLPAKDNVKKAAKPPTPGPTTLSKSGTKPGLASQSSTSHLPTIGKPAASIYPALPTSGPGLPTASSVKLISTTATAAAELNVTTASASGTGPARNSVVANTKKSIVQSSTVKQSLGDGKQPSQALQAQMQARLQAQIQATRQEEQRVPSEQIELPDIASEYSDSDDEDRPKKYTLPDWAQSPELRAQLMAQRSVNPDAIFGAIRPLHMDEIFRTRQSRFRARTSSANWAGNDRLTPQEEMEYARRMGFM